MTPGRVVSYVAVFAAGALALAGFTAVTDNPEPPSVQPVSQVSSEPVSQPTSSNSVDSEPLTQIGEITRNTMVTVQGTVQAITDEDEFTLVDDSGSIQVWTAGTLFTVDPGEQVTVEGFVDDDLIVELYAQQITRADGSVIEINRSSSY